MRLMLPSRLISALAAAAIALTTFTPAPAYADNDRNVRALATILGLAVVGKIIHDNNKDDKKKRKLKKQRKVKREAYRQAAPRGWHNDNLRRDRPYYNDHGYAQPKPRPLPRRVDRKLLPKHCFQNIQTRKGSAQIFERRCLKRSYQFTDRIPQSCAQRVRTRAGTLTGYDARCLRRNGYSLARG